MWIEQIFYIAFLSQILLISYYYPKRILGRIDYVFEHFPADKYAKLYPKGYEKALEGKILFKVINIIILVIGLIIFVSAVAGNQQGNIELKDMDFYPLGYGILQFVPFLMLELSAFKQFKLMRNQNDHSKRHAELSPRNLFKYISPLRLLSTVCIFFICIYIMFSFNDFTMSKDIAVLIGSMLLCNGLFVGLGYVLINGKKLDPHQSPADRHNMIMATFRTYSSVSILVSLFFIINRFVSHYSLSDWEPLFNSLYWQCLVLLSTGAMLKLNKLEEVNFEVYRTSASSNS